jgi:3-isopropylmalate/(R)-2-methylmalate dehydratase small subunit
MMAQVILRLGDDVSTDAIYPGRFMATVLPSETPQHAFADLEVNAALRAGVFPAGSVIVAGENFGCGSSREQAASTLKGHGLVIVAKSVARIFLQNAVNLGLQVIVCPQCEADVGDEIDVFPERVVSNATGKSYPTIPLPPARRSILEAGGLIEYARRRLVDSKGGFTQANG